MFWDEKPYYSLNYFLKNKFQTKVVKLSLDGGFTCPNRDGKISTGGCSFCSGRGSGDFIPVPLKSITEQIHSGKLLTFSKWNHVKYIAYFQAFTNTYASVSVLRQKYEEALSSPDIIGIAIATRPDCISDEILSLLSEINQKTYLWVELGFQTSNEHTAIFINRGYKNDCFDTIVKKLREKNIDVVAHMIIGLPNESYDDILNTLHYLSHSQIQGIKLQLLHILKDTPLATYYNKIGFPVLTQQVYISIIIKCIGYLNPNIVIHRLTGDGAKESLITPLWSLDKRGTLNMIHKELKNHNIFQGKWFSEV